MSVPRDAGRRWHRVCRNTQAMQVGVGIRVLGCIVREEVEDIIEDGVSRTSMALVFVPGAVLEDFGINVHDD